ncbi:MAG: magnesium chelatase [Dictyoglomus sp. NZ13-RE01]|nr:MAG: magnesium chelatase [Dictyoglomus sp. NZ13-RE01]
MKNIFNKINELKSNIKKVIIGKDNVIDYVIVSLLSQGNILLEDVPGVGKTVLAKALAESINLDFRRIQFTPDMLPSDILGTNVFNPKTLEFEFKKGPIFTNILLADEINRTSPRTQAGLLEAMDEGGVTIDGIFYPLPKPFLVIATQNPREHFGTYPLPESQLDRFFMSLTMGYLSLEEEVRMLNEQKLEHPLDKLTPVWEKEDVFFIQEQVKQVYLDKSILEFIANIVRATREDPKISLGAGPRGSISLMRASQAMALLRERDYVIPEDVLDCSIPILVHRIVLKEQIESVRQKREEIIKEIIERVKIPKVKVPWR